MDMSYILEYFVPGFIAITLFNFLTSRKNSPHLISGSIVISYILKSVFSCLHHFIFKNYDFLHNQIIIILIVISIILSIISVKVYESSFMEKIFTSLNHKSLHDNILNDVIDYEKGTILRMVCDGEIITGMLVSHEENGKDSWYILKNYIVEESEGSYSSENIDAKSLIAINLNNVRRIELFYQNE